MVHTNVHLQNMCPADVEAMKKGPILCVCVYMRKRESEKFRGNMERQEIPEECKYMSRRKREIK